MIEGDDLQPVGNVEKMRRGEPLTDADRWPWLEALAQAASRGLAGPEGREGVEGLVLTCSALRRVYRDFLREAMPTELRFIFPIVSSDRLMERVATRSHAFFPPELLASQLASFEQPGAGEPDCLLVDGERDLDAVAEEVMARLGRP